jgi:hypothetical protein
MAPRVPLPTQLRSLRNTKAAFAPDCRDYPHQQMLLSSPILRKTYWELQLAWLVRFESGRQ